MIYSDLVNGGYYAATDEKIALCLAYAPKLNKDTPCGRYVLSDDVYVNVMSYEPKPVEEAVAETHLVYADLQLILDGAEWMGCADVASLVSLSAYDDQKDIALWNQKDIPLLPMRKGNWALFMPGEPHAPSLKMQNGTASSVDTIPGMYRPMIRHWTICTTRWRAKARKRQTHITDMSH